MEKLRPNFIEEQYQCGFLTHVQSATLLIGALGSFASAAVLSMLLKAEVDPELCVFNGVVLFSYALLVLGWSSRAPCLYWPFLLINPLVICFCALFCTYPAMAILIYPIVSQMGDEWKLTADQRVLFQVTRSLRMMELASSLCAILLFAYFQSIVFRAHNWQRKQNKLDEQLVIIGDRSP